MGRPSHCILNLISCNLYPVFCFSKIQTCQMNITKLHIYLIFMLLFACKIYVSAQTTNAKDYEVAVYYFPNYHVDSINERWHGKGWTEWDLVKNSQPRFKGHQQPKTPAWGYFDEADPKWAAKEIDLASSNGIDVFIYDWYW